MTDPHIGTGKTEYALKEAFKAQRKNNQSIIMTTQDAQKEWQCIECGHVVEQGNRPGSCPNCNCVDGDFPHHVRLFIRREACGWFE